MVSTDARPGVRSTFGPVSLAYEPELKVGFCVDRPKSCACVRASAACGARNSILPASWGFSRGVPSLCTPRPSGRKAECGECGDAPTARRGRGSGRLTSFQSSACARLGSSNPETGTNRMLNVLELAARSMRPARASSRLSAAVEAPALRGPTPYFLPWPGGVPPWPGALPECPGAVPLWPGALPLRPGELPEWPGVLPECPVELETLRGADPPSLDEISADGLPFSLFLACPFIACSAAFLAVAAAVHGPTVSS